MLFLSFLCLEAVWDYTFKKICRPEKLVAHKVEIMFEKYGFAGVNVSVQAFTFSMCILWLV